jgi:hypothetical protein
MANPNARVKYIASYWVDGKPSNGFGLNKGRQTAIGYFVGGNCVLSFPPRLNDYKMPTLKDAANLLKGQ